MDSSIATVLLLLNEVMKILKVYTVAEGEEHNTGAIEIAVLEINRRGRYEDSLIVLTAWMDFQ